MDSVTYNGKNIFDCSEEELRQISKIAKRAWSVLQQKKVTNFAIGDTVTFNAKGVVLTGTVEKINQKTVSVRVSPTERWKVTGTLLTKAPSEADARR